MRKTLALLVGAAIVALSGCAGSAASQEAQSPAARLSASPSTGPAASPTTRPAASPGANGSTASPGANGSTASPGANGSTASRIESILVPGDSRDPMLLRIEFVAGLRVEALELVAGPGDDPGAARTVLIHGRGGEGIDVLSLDADGLVADVQGADGSRASIEYGPTQATGTYWQPNGETGSATMIYTAEQRAAYERRTSWTRPARPIAAAAVSAGDPNYDARLIAFTAPEEITAVLVSQVLVPPPLLESADGSLATADNVVYEVVVGGCNLRVLTCSPKRSLLVPGMVGVTVRHTIAVTGGVEIQRADFERCIDGVRDETVDKIALGLSVVGLLPNIVGEISEVIGLVNDIGEVLGTSEAQCFERIFTEGLAKKIADAVPDLTLTVTVTPIQAGETFDPPFLTLIYSPFMVDALPKTNEAVLTFPPQTLVPTIFARVSDQHHFAMNGTTDISDILVKGGFRQATPADAGPAHLEFDRVPPDSAADGAWTASGKVSAEFALPIFPFVQFGLQAQYEGALRAVGAEETDESRAEFDAQSKALEERLEGCLIVRTWEGIVASGAFPAGKSPVGTVTGEMDFKTVAILRNCERLTRDDYDPAVLEELAWSETAPWTLGLTAARRGVGSVTTSEGVLWFKVGS